VSHTSDPKTTTRDTFQPDVVEHLGNRFSPRGWALRGFVGILVTAGIGVAAFIWLGSSRDAAKTAPPPQPAPPLQVAVQQAPSQPAPLQPAPVTKTVPPAAAAPAELTPLLARDLASQGREIEQLKASREQMARDNANLGEQLKSSQEQLTRIVAQLSEQLKASQDQLARGNANTAEQIRGIQEQLARVITQASEQNAPPRIAAAPPRPAAPAARKPVPTLSAPQATTRPNEKPKLSSTSRPPARLGPFLHRPCRPHYDEQPIGFIHSRPSAILGYFISEVPVSRVRFAARIGRGNRTIFVWDVCGDRERVGFEPKVKCHVQGFDSGSYPPISFPTGAVQFAMMGATAIHHCQSARLRKAQMVRVAGALVGSRGRAAWLQSVGAACPVAVSPWAGPGRFCRCGSGARRSRLEPVRFDRRDALIRDLMETGEGIQIILESERPFEGLRRGASRPSRRQSRPA
jgi:hypothetical protein